MAFRQDLKYIHRKLFGDDILSLSPLNQKSKKFLIFILKREYLWKNITLSLKEKYWLSLEVKWLHNSLFHLFVVILCDSITVIKEILFEKYTWYHGNLSLFTSHVSNEKLHESSWIWDSSIVKLCFCTLSGCIVRSEEVFDEVGGFHFQNE